MKDILFGERVVERGLVPDSGSFPAEVSELTKEIAREAGLENVLRIIASPDGVEAVTFLQYLWSGMESPQGVEAVMETESSLRPDALAQQFHHLANVWREECAHLSSIREMVLHPAYQQIVGMGPSALPYIFAELERKPDHWFWALRAITEEEPVLPEHRGNVAAMARDWLDWAKQRGISW